jgi:ubiquinone/menaquinone biosynthesis C-methylase UbiE
MFCLGTKDVLTISHLLILLSQMKDNFSAGSDIYAQFRPGYPDILVDWLCGQLSTKEIAWDCATGNGQLARKLAEHFGQVYATDISNSQLAQAPQHHRIIYQKEPAESSSFADKTFDLITVAQAVHWFDFNAFYAEVHRTLKDEGLFAVVGYTLPTITVSLDAVIQHFYSDIVGPYWDTERHYIDESYSTIPFPFIELDAPSFRQQYSWRKEQLLGYLNTWSAVKHYIGRKGSDPIALITEALDTAWGNKEYHDVTFPILLRAGRKLV